MKIKINQRLNKKILKEFSLKNNKNKLTKKFDLFITCSGFEKRTLGLIHQISDETQIGKTCIFLYKPHEENLYLKNLESLVELKKELKRFNIGKNEVIGIDPSNPWKFRDVVNQIITANKISSGSKVLLDITSFTRVFLYEIIKGLHSSNCEFLIGYTEPQEYVEPLPTGINKIIISPSFSGKPRPNQKSVLLLFLGWETGRTSGLYEEYDPDECILAIGKNPIDKKHVVWSYQSYKNNEKLINYLDNTQETSTLDLKEIFDFIFKTHQKKIEEYKDSNTKFYFVIGGLGPKIQNIAACFYSILNNEVQLVYGTPAYWGSSNLLPLKNPIESKGIGRTYLYGPYDKNSIKKFKN
jgi:hypothetical protein